MMAKVPYNSREESEGRKGLCGLTVELSDPENEYLTDQFSTYMKMKILKA